MKRRQAIALQINNRVIAWSEDLHRNVAVVVTKVNAKSFQGETIGETPEKLTGLSRFTAWTLKEFEKKEPEEFYRMFPNKRPQMEPETVNSLQPDLSNSVIQQGEIAESWNSENFGDLEFAAEPNGQLNLLKTVTIEPPDPDDFADLTKYEEAWADWEKQNKPVKVSMDENYTEEENNSNSINGHLPAPAKLEHDYKVGDFVAYAGWPNEMCSIEKIIDTAIRIKDNGCFNSVWVNDLSQISKYLTSAPEETKLETTENNVTNIKIDAIELLKEMQPRYKNLGMTNQLFCDMGVERSLERINNGEPMKPVTVFRVGERLILTSGFHRIEASRRAGKSYIPAIIKEGSFEEARMDAACSNRDNGIPLGDSDIGEAIRMFLQSLSEMGKNMSLRAIAKEIGCSHTQVANIKNRLEFEEKLKGNSIEIGKRFKHKESGVLGEIFQIQWIAKGVNIEWDYGSPKFSQLIPIDDFLKDFTPTTLPKVKEPVNTLQTSFDSVENETKAKARSLGLPSSKKGVFPDCDDKGDGDCLQADRNTPPEMEAPTAEQCYTPTTEVIKINPNDLVIGIISNIDLLSQEHCNKIWDAIADKLPNPIRVEDMTEKQIRALMNQAQDELNRRNVRLPKTA